MQVGIYTRYFRHEATYAAIRIAEQLQCDGHDVSLFSNDVVMTPTCPQWDAKVVRTGPRGFTAWARDQDVLIWTHAPNPAQVGWAKHNNKHVVLVAVGYELRSVDRKTYRAADVVVCPSRSLADLLRSRWSLKTCMPVTWDCGWPVTTKTAISVNKLRVLLPTEFCSAPFEMQTLGILAAAVEANEALEVTVTYTPSRWQPIETRILREFLKMSPQRVTLLKSTPLAALPLLYQRHDLTLWPTVCDNFGLGGIFSLTMGTPVVAFDATPMNELVAGNNGVLLSCDQTATSLGLPVPRPNFRNLLSTFIDLSYDRDAITSMLSYTDAVVTRRRREFQKAWRIALP